MDYAQQFILDEVEHIYNCGLAYEERLDAIAVVLSMNHPEAQTLIRVFKMVLEKEKQ
jgi:hypothetical protein